MEIQEVLGSSLPPRVSSYSRPTLHLLPRLTARRCVLLIVFSRYKSPCPLPIKMTRCPEYPQTFRRNWTLHSRRTFRSMRDKVQRRVRFCHNHLFSFLFLHPFRNLSSAADVKQMEKIVPFITCAFSLY